MPRQPKRLIGIAVCAFWLVMMALLLRRESGPASSVYQVTPALRLAEPTSRWMAILTAQGERIGTITLRSIPDARGGEAGARVFLRTELATNVLGQETRFSLDGSAWVAADGGMRTFDATMRSGPHEVRIEGEAAEGRLLGNLHTGGETLPLDLPMPAEMLSSGGTLPGGTLPSMRPGDTLEIDAFDPVTMSPRKATLRCVGAEQRVIAGEAVDTYVVEAKIGLLTTKAWLSGDGEILRAETPFGFAIERISEEEALTGTSGDTELLGGFAVRAAGTMPWRGAEYMKIRLSGAPVDSLPEDTPYQRRSGDEIEITMPPEPAGDTPVDTAALAAHLGSDAFVTPDHPRIRAAAREAVGEAGTAWEKARRLHDWVFANIEKTPAITLPAALDVLDTRHGDCNEHAVLYAALARAVGVPTRIAVGLVWSDELAGFAYHAWVEVWCGGAWTPMDPTLGQPVADATHIKLIEGGIEHWTGLLPYFARLAIEVVEVR